MKIKAFRNKILSIPRDNESAEYPIYELYGWLNRLVEFLEDDDNISVLEKREKDDDINHTQSPLDVLCKRVLEEFEEKIYGKLGNEVMDVLKHNNSGENYYDYPEIEDMTETLQSDHFRNMLYVLDKLKHLDGHNKSLIILGPNGSGKSSFANDMEGRYSHIKVISVPHLIENRLNNALVSKICSEYDDVLRLRAETDNEVCDAKFVKIREIFDEVFDVKLDTSGFSDKKVRGKNAKDKIFDLDNMSDGEKVAFFCISTVISAEEKSFIIVDEPESYLNPAIYNKIWDRLIEARNDCQFIFISHNMDFVSARTDFELAIIKKFSYPNYFEFDFLGDDLDKINPEFIVEIVGSRKPILFCEGSKKGYDYKVYTRLFGENYTVVPTGSNMTVKESVGACKLHANRYNIQSAIGIVDSDLMSKEQRVSLREKDIYTLRCNEIEMLLIDESIFNQVIAIEGAEKSTFDEFKSKVFGKIEEKKDDIIRRLVKMQIEESYCKAIIDDKHNKTKEQIKANHKKIYENIDVDTMWDACDSRITSIIEKQDYEGALRYCCLEHDEILKKLCNQYISDYANKALDVLEKDAIISEIITEKYFKELPREFTE